MTTDQHANPTRETPLTDDDVKAPSHAERARTLVAGQTTGALSTLDPQGFPHGSYVTFALMGADPVLLISKLATHTQHLLRDPRASLLVHESGATDPLANGRVTLIGTCEKAPDADAARQAFLAVHPGAAYYAGFADFAFYRLAVTSVRYIGGYGRMSWVDADDLRAATPDPMAADAAGVLAHMNDDHAEALLSYARAFTRAEAAESAVMIGIDRYGFEMSVKTPVGARPARIAFTAEIETPDEARKALVALVKEARKKLGADSA
jgi:hypothetical protein